MSRIGSTRALTRSFSGMSTHSQDFLDASAPLVGANGEPDAKKGRILSTRGMFILICACLSCFSGGTMYAYGVWGSKLKAATNLSQVQTNILAGLLFSGGSFLTKPILDHVKMSIRSAALAPALAGAVAYACLGALPVSYLSMNVLVLLMCIIGYSVMGLFIAGVQAIDYLSKKENFNLNVGTAIAQTSYGIGCMVWVGVLKYVDNDFQLFCSAVVGPTALTGILASLAYPTSLQVETTYDIDTSQPPAAKDAKETGSKLADEPKNDMQKYKGKDILLALILALYCIWYGSAIALESNSGNIMESLGAGDNAFFLVLGFGVGQTIGRLSSLFFALWARSGDEQKASLRLLTQPLVGCVLLVCVHAYAAFTPATPRSAFFTIAISGIPYGLSWTSLFHTIDAVFASDAFCITMGMAFGPGLGPLLMNMIVGILYEMQIGNGNESGAKSAGQTCVGSHCYATSYVALLGFDLIALALAVLVFFICQRSSLPVKFSSGDGDAKSKRQVAAL
mmetsp:Transcript_27635/g.67214  ORF Transcript_27635/g.67214 Transcript_27635/m.67214 type:complete len:508 (-) Transcript_27635:274-1797(-)